MTAVSKAVLGPNDPFSRRFSAWAAERFPAPLLLIAILSGAASVLLGMRVLAGSQAAPVGLVDLAGPLAFYLFLFVLRVMDEHKDFADDVVNHPERVLQRGLITLGSLRVLAFVAVALQLGVSLWADGGFGWVTIAWLVAFAWSLLMLKEFFVGEWLKPRMMTYAVTHAVVTPLTTVWLVFLGARGAPGAHGWVVAVWALTAMMTGLTFELTRKTFVPADERAGIDSYSKVLGVRGAVSLILGTMALSVVGFVAAVGILQDRVPLWTPVAAGALLVVCAVPYFSFLKKLKSGSTSRIEGAAALQMIGTYVMMVVAMIVEGGITWS